MGCCKLNTPKLRYNELSCQAPFVHYIAKFTISWLFNSKGSWHLFTISRNSLYRDSLYRSLGVYIFIYTIQYICMYYVMFLAHANTSHFSSIHILKKFKLTYTASFVPLIRKWLRRGIHIVILLLKWKNSAIKKWLPAMWLKG